MSNNHENRTQKSFIKTCHCIFGNQCFSDFTLRSVVHVHIYAGTPYWDIYDNYVFIDFKVKVHLKNENSYVCIHYLLTLVPSESHAKLCTPQNISGAKQNCSILLSNWGRLGLVLKTTKNVGVIWVSRMILALKRVQIISFPWVYGAILMFRRRRKGGVTFLKQVPIYFSCLGELLPNHFAMRLHLAFHQHGGE